MKVGHFNHSDMFGGAARYACRTVESQLEVGIDAKLFVNVKKSQNEYIQIVGPTPFQRVNSFLNRVPQTLDRCANTLETEEIRNFKSPALFGSLNLRMLSRLDLDIAHLHWINGGFISIKLLGKIKLPIVWSILDMWPLSGAEHYMSGHDELRLMKSYSKDSRNFNDRGIDISRIAWKKKTQNYGRYNVIFPGDWMLRKNARGTLFDRMRHFVIPPAINTQIYRVYNKVTIRSQLNLPLDKKIIGYFGGISSRKGWHLIEEIINSDFLSSNSILMILVGDCFPSTYSSNPNLRIFKKTSVDDELVRLYNSLDLLVAPSMQEAYGLVAQEAQSCGVPCVVSANSGLQDVILDNQTGLLSPVNSSIVLGKKILELANSSELRERMGSTSRARALDLWDSKVVATKLKGLYEEILSDE